MRVFFRFDLVAEAERAGADAPLDRLGDAVERAAADEQDVRGVDLDELLLRMLAPAVRRNVGHRALQDLQQRLLHALTADIAGDGRVLAAAGDLVDLVDIDDAALRTLDVVIRCLDQAQQDVLHILADIARLGQRGSIGDGERDIQRTRQRLRQRGLAHAGRAEQQHVALAQLRIQSFAVIDALIMVVHRNGQRDLRLVLSDDVLVQLLLDLARGGQ